MVPYLGSHDSVMTETVSIDKVKAVLGVDHVGLEPSAKPPVADDFMYDFQYNHPLPTLESLGVEIPADCNAQKEAERLVSALSNVWSSCDAQGFADLFLDEGVWRDKLAFTWDYRTFNFKPNILKAAKDLLSDTKASNLRLLKPAPKVDHPFPDYSQLQFVVGFETVDLEASAVVNAVLTKHGWRIYTMHTVAESLKEFPELSPADGHMNGSTSWERQRAAEVDAADPEVLVIGGGQNGLAIAARLKMLGMSALIVERSAEVGDVWKKRYEYLSLHFPHWADDLPYFTYPKHWPTYTPAQKQGLYMEWFASAHELSVWTESNVIKAEQDDQSGAWTVNVDKGGKETRTLHPQHVIMATSLCGKPMSPVVPGMEEFTGTIRHSSAHDSSRDFVGKRVCVVGTSSSGFDTAFDCSRRGVDVTLLQRSPTYVMSLTHSVPRVLGAYAPNQDLSRPDIEDVDRVFFSGATGPGEELARRNAKVLADLDRPLLEALNAKGLKTWLGQRGTGNSTLSQTRNGGFYFDAGACEDIINGKIKVAPGYIESFTKDKVILNGGREEHFDVVIFATGFTNMIDSVRETLGDKVADKCGPVRGIDEEGEYKTAYKETGVPNMWIMVGFLAGTRYHSKLLAMRLKALKEGVGRKPYKA